MYTFGKILCILYIHISLCILLETPYATQYIKHKCDISTNATQNVPYYMLANVFFESSTVSRMCVDGRLWNVIWDVVSSVLWDDRSEFQVLIFTFKLAKNVKHADFCLMCLVIKDAALVKPVGCLLKQLIVLNIFSWLQRWVSHVNSAISVAKDKPTWRPESLLWGKSKSFWSREKKENQSYCAHIGHNQYPN